MRDAHRNIENNAMQEAHGGDGLGCSSKTDRAANQRHKSSSQNLLDDGASNMDRVMFAARIVERPTISITIVSL